jgi:hypothetical protein
MVKEPCSETFIPKPLILWEWYCVHFSQDMESHWFHARHCKVYSYIHYHLVFDVILLIWAVTQHIVDVLKTNPGNRANDGLCVASCCLRQHLTSSRLVSHFVPKANSTMPPDIAGPVSNYCQYWEKQRPKMLTLLMER